MFCRINKGDKIISMLYSELKQKQVINFRNCNRLGYITDLEIDKCTGQILKIRVTNHHKWCPFISSEPDYIINVEV